MKKGKLILFFTIALLLVSVVSAAAETMYVSDRLEVFVLAGSSPKYRAIDKVKADQEVEVINYEEDYAFVKTPRGKEGWMLKRYLTTETPKAIVIENYRNKLNMLKKRNACLRLLAAALGLLSSCITQEYPGINVLVVRGGHAYDTPQFEEMCGNLEGINADLVLTSHMERMSADEIHERYDAILFLSSITFIFLFRPPITLVSATSEIFLNSLAVSAAILLRS